MNSLSRSKTAVFMILLVVSWGVGWPIYKMAVPYTPPLLFAGMRTLFGGLLLAILFMRNAKKIRFRENWILYVISSVFNIILFYGLQTVGLMYMPAGLFTVLVYFQPVLVGILAWLWLGEPMSAGKVIGLATGFIGVAVIGAGGFSGHLALIGIVLALITALAWALGTVYIKKISDRVDAVWLVACQCIIGGALLSAAGLVTEQVSDIVWNTPYLTGLIFGITIGIPLTWFLYFALVNAGDASRVASITFLVPVLAVLIGTFFLGEPFTYYLVIGLLLIGASIYLVNRPVHVDK